MTVIEGLLRVFHLNMLKAEILRRILHCTQGALRDKIFSSSMFKIFIV